jgi:DNA modification methylase
MMMMMKDAGLEVRHVLIWVKNSATFSIGRLDYDYQHEPIMFTWKKTHKRLNKGQFHTSVWTVDKPRESKLHPTMKPVALIENALLNSSEAGDLVLDIFGGSGSTLIACEKTHRRCFMMELSPAYCEVIVTRWEQATGKKATLDGTATKGD